MSGSGRESMDQQARTGAGAMALLKRIPAAYRVVVVTVSGILVYAIATPAYAATTGSHPSHIYTIGRQSTLTGAIIILVISVVSIRRNLRRSAVAGGLVEMSPLSRPGQIDRPRAGN